MNPERESQLAAEIDRELKNLPDLAAPVTLIPGVLAALQNRNATAWYCRSWPHWPRLPRIVFVAAMLVLFGLASFGMSEVFAADRVAFAIESLNGPLAIAASVLSLLTIFASALVAVLKAAGPLFITILIAFAALNYFLCIGVGTLFFRVTRAPRIQL